MELNNREMEINEKKKILIDIMKAQEKDRHIDKLESVELSPSPARLKTHENAHKREQMSTDTKSVNESKSSKSS